MSSVSKRSRGKVKAKVYKSADHWPSWTDDAVYVPTEHEQRWADENLNHNDDYHADEPTPDDVLERQADEAIALDQLERGLRHF